MQKSRLFSFDWKEVEQESGKIQGIAGSRYEEVSRKENEDLRNSEVKRNKNWKT